jgi:hypothetical protein
VYVPKRRWINKGPRPRRVCVRGVGAYPDETCFDPARPSWLPYWIDDLTESGCKLNLIVSGNPTGNTAQPGTFNADGTPAATPGAVQNAMAACAAQSGTWNATLQVCTPSLLSQWGSYLPWIAAALVAVAVLPAVVGGRR